MDQPSSTGVFLCRGGHAREESNEFRRIRWMARAGSDGDRVFEITQACQAEGAEAMARLAREHHLDNLLLGACPLAAAGGPLTSALRSAGLSPDRLTMIDLCQRPDGELGACNVAEGAEQALREALAACEGRRQVAEQVMNVSTTVMVVGSGFAALLATENLVSAGLSAIMVTPHKRLAPPEPLLGEDARSKSLDLAAWARKAPEVQLIRGGELLELSGGAGGFRAVVRDMQRRTENYEIGAVVVTQGPPRELNLPWPAESHRIVSLEELAALADAQEHLLQLAGGEGFRLGLALGLDRQSRPADLRLALKLGSKLIDERAAQVTLFVGQGKMAATDLSLAAQEARAKGMIFVKQSKHTPRVEAVDNAVTVHYFEEILQREIPLELDLMAVDQRPAVDRAYHQLAEVLGLSVAAEGSLAPDRVAALPSHAGRGGVYLAGEAAGGGDLSQVLDQVGWAMSEIRALLRQGQVSAVKDAVRVDRRRCALCLTCVRVCPSQAMGRAGRLPTANPLVCTACGTCAAECPMDAIELVNLEDGRYRNRIKAVGDQTSSVGQDPLTQEVLVLVCENSAGVAIRNARLGGGRMPKGARLVRVPCAGRIDPQMVLDSLRRGMDAVLILGCHPQACFSQTGNLWADWRVEHLHGLLQESGMDPRRVKSLAFASAQANEIIEAAEDYLAEMAGLGPNPLKAEARARELISHFTQPMDQTFTILE